MNSNDYYSKLNALLEDKNTYTKLRSDPTNKFKNRLAKLLKGWRDSGKISHQTWLQLYPSAAEPPKFYRLPKIHKTNVPMRPIVSSRESITYEAAKMLSKILGPLVGKTPYHVKNSITLSAKSETGTTTMEIN